MLRLGLMRLAENIRSGNVLNPMAAPAIGGSRSSLLSSLPPAPSTEMPSARRNPMLQFPANARTGRILLKIAVMAALLIGGYLAGAAAEAVFEQRQSCIVEQPLLRIFQPLHFLEHIQDHIGKLSIRFSDK